ncbi:bifunctional hydroxymethylpyrimidine kinase/phosphomethylpyrimidine kinase [Acidiphilium sp.]|uniref:bifunctional hydroxymethylpyrimidine kinase/phosphomethylpyrimidine kinase n=1 Tax=Acidiphilium sp. TaxID=527 RepID=UPI0025858EAF|nr:bifunctional hydroxymethylpyrimidine kinase/phosphomethylpyrimidine kinase [Acidiphilium sp.]
MDWFRVLAIGGSDSGGGAGIEADVKTITALGGYAMTAITAVTAQDTSGIAAIAPVPPDVVARSIRMVVADLGVDAIKLGMLGSAGTAEEVALAIAAAAPAAPLVLDPVLASTSGTALAGEGALAIIRDRLLPRATLVTPNRDEAATLAGLAIDSHEDAIRAGRALCRLGARAVLLKGGHFDGDPVIDRLIAGDDVLTFAHPRIATRHTHGTGCTLASAIACGLARGLDLRAAIEAAEAFLHAALRAAPGLGRGHGPLGHARAAALLQDRPPA